MKDLRLKFKGIDDWNRRGRNLNSVPKQLSLYYG